MRKLRLKAPARVVADYFRLFVNRRAKGSRSFRSTTTGHRFQLSESMRAAFSEVQV